VSDAKGGAAVNAVAALFQTVNTVIVPAGSGLVLILKADPRRVYVQFTGFGGFATNPLAYPAPKPTAIIAQQNTSLAQSYKLRDCPAMTVGEWYGFADGTTGWIITEQIFVGG
jgi:hypothetical protein